MSKIKLERLRVKEREREREGSKRKGQGVKEKGLRERVGAKRLHIQIRF